MPQLPWKNEPFSGRYFHELIDECYWTKIDSSEFSLKGSFSTDRRAHYLESLNLVTKGWEGRASWANSAISALSPVILISWWCSVEIKLVINLDHFKARYSTNLQLHHVFTGEEDAQILGGPFPFNDVGSVFFFPYSHNHNVWAGLTS